VSNAAKEAIDKLEGEDDEEGENPAAPAAKKAAPKKKAPGGLPKRKAQSP
jgi:hypothetical protein